MSGPPGQYGTVYSSSREENGQEVLFPTIYDGKAHGEDEAWQHYKQTGQHMGKFANANDADKFAQKYHEDAAAGKYDTPSSAPASSPSGSHLNSLVEKIRTAHPGAYDDMDDATLTKRVLAKYPQYSDLAAPKVKPPANPILDAKTSDDENRDALSAAGESLYDVTAPGIASQLYKKFTGQPNEAEKLPGKIMSTALPMMVGEDVPLEAKPSETASIGRPSSSRAPTVSEPGPGVAGRVGRVIARRIPGVKLGEDLIDAIKGPIPEVPAPRTPDVPLHFGKGKYGVPVSEWGKAIPPETAIPAETLPPPRAETIGRPTYPTGKNIDLQPGMQTPGGAVVAPRIRGLLTGEVEPTAVPEKIEAPIKAPTRETVTRPARARIGSAEWKAGHEIGGEIENSPKPGLSSEDKTAEFLKTPQGQKFARIYQETLAEHRAGNIPEAEAEPEETDLAEIPRKPPEGTTIPQTSEEMEDALKRSIGRLKKK